MQPMIARPAPTPARHVALPPCDGCGELDTGAYGFAPPGWPSLQNFCADCTPSRTGSLGLTTAAEAAKTVASGHVDLFGRI